MSHPLSTKFAELALETFASLPAKCKPRTLPDGSREWTPMSAIILSRVSTPARSPESHESQLHDRNVKLISLATGTKSLPISAVPKCMGLVLHDSHAEILALRGLNYWLLTEIDLLLRDDEYQSDWLERLPLAEEGDSSLRPFRLRQNTEISLFSTEAPCGDASMELLMAAAESSGHDIRPWPTKAGTHTTEGQSLPLGRSFFSNLGALRRKPARADAEISMSKSCTDKLMLKQFTSILSFSSGLLIQNSPEAFLKRVVVYEDQYSEKGYTRAFDLDGRLQAVFAADDTGMCAAARLFEVCTLPSAFRRFEFEKQRGAQETITKKKASNIATLWIAGGAGPGNHAVLEVLVNGVKQGFKQFDERERKGSVTCRRNLVMKATELQKLLQRKGSAAPELGDDMPCSYSKLKSSASKEHRSNLKELVLDRLGGWPKEYPKDDFNVDTFPNPT